MYVPTVLTQTPSHETETELGMLAARWSRALRRGRRKKQTSR
jgi:hypothetical protein